MTVLVTGHETTAGALTWAIYLLCKNPSMQNRLREEIRGNLPNPLSSDANPIISTMIDNLPYLNAVCQVVFRLYLPVSITMCEAIVDTSILDYRIPKRTVVLISPWAVNNSTRLWDPDAMTFNPDRRLNSPSGGVEGGYSFLTFLQGSRNCIGQGFAKAEFACLLAAWVGSFETELPDKEKEVLPSLGFIMKPRDGRG